VRPWWLFAVEQTVIFRHSYPPEYLVTYMQTLNVGAGRTDEDYKAAEESRLADLRSDVQTYAMYFFVAAGLSALGTGLLIIKLNLIVNIGAFDLFLLYGRDLHQGNFLVIRAVAAAWALVLIGLGFAARKNQRWAFWVGVILYSADMVPAMLLSLLWGIFAVGVHGFFVMQWFKGQKALGELRDAAASKAAVASR
jgi:hypothetical protein